MPWSRVTAIGLSLLTLTVSPPAFAETSVVKCERTSEFIGIIGFTYYKIGDGRWLSWDKSSNKWGVDLCKELMKVSHCEFTSDMYYVVGTYPDQVSTISVEINRMTGAMVARNDFNALGNHFQETGICARASDPPPPPKPKL